MRSKLKPALKSAKEWFDDGEKLYDQKKYQEAIKCYEEALVLDSKHVDSWNSKGLALGQLDQYSEAVWCYDKALTFDSEFIPAVHNKGAALCNLEDYTGAIECYEKYLTHKPKNTRLLIEKGNCLIALEKHQDAITCFDNVLKKEPENDMAYRGKGLVFFHLRQYTKAIDCYDKSIALNPKFSTYYYEKGIPLYRLGEYNKAIDCYNQALNLDPKEIDSWKGKGFALEELGLYKEALTCYEKMLEIDHGRVDALKCKARVCYHLHEYSKAIDCYNQALKLDPKMIDAWKGKGSALEELGLYTEALTCYEKMLEIDPSHVNALKYKAIVWYSLGEYEKGLENINRALNHETTSALFWNTKGLLNFYLENMEQAAVCFKNTLINDPQFNHGLLNQAFLLIIENKLTESELFLGKLVMKNPYEEALLLLGKGLIAFLQKQLTIAEDLHTRAETILKTCEFTEQLEFHHLHGKVLLMLGFNQKAVVAFQKGLKLKADYIPIQREIKKLNSDMPLLESKLELPKTENSSNNVESKSESLFATTSASLDNTTLAKLLKLADQQLEILQASPKESPKEDITLLQKRLSGLENSMDHLDGEVLEILKGKATETRALISQATEQKQIEAERLQIESDDCLCDFYYVLRSQVLHTWQACQVIHSGMVDNDQKTKLDYLADGIDKLGKHFPGLSLLTGFIKGAASAWDHRQKKQAMLHLASFSIGLIDGDILIDTIARQLTLFQAAAIKEKLNKSKTGHFRKALDQFKKIKNWVLVNEIDSVTKEFAAKTAEKVLKVIMEGKIKTPCKREDLSKLFSLIVGEKAVYQSPLVTTPITAKLTSNQSVVITNFGLNGADSLPNPINSDVIELKRTIEEQQRWKIQQEEKMKAMQEELTRVKNQHQTKEPIARQQDLEQLQTELSRFKTHLQHKESSARKEDLETLEKELKKLKEGFEQAGIVSGGNQAQLQMNGSSLWSGNSASDQRRIAELERQVQLLTQAVLVSQEQQGSTKTLQAQC